MTVTPIEGGITAAAGFRAAGVSAGIKASGKSQVYTPTPAEKEMWMKAMRPVQDEMASRVGKDTIAAIRAATSAK